MEKLIAEMKSTTDLRTTFGDYGHMLSTHNNTSDFKTNLCQNANMSPLPSTLSLPMTISFSQPNSSNSNKHGISSNITNIN